MLNYGVADKLLDDFISEIVLNLSKTITNKEFKKIYEEKFVPIFHIKYGEPKSAEKKTIFFVDTSRDLFFILKHYGIEVIDTPQEKIDYKEHGFKRLAEVAEKIVATE